MTDIKFRGAVLSRINDCPTVISTQAVRHYGNTNWTPYVTMRDEGQPQELCPLDGITRVQTVRYLALTQPLLLSVNWI